MMKAKPLEKAREKCGNQNLKTHLIIYPLKMVDKQINVGRVSVKDCMNCHTLKPRKAGQAKIERCTMVFMPLLG